MSTTSARFVAITSSLAIVVTASFGQSLRVAAWNISNYSGGRGADIGNAVYGSFEGRSFSPDVIIGQEINSASAASTFVSILNSAVGSPGDWAASFDTTIALGGSGSANDAVLFYRSSKVSLLGSPINVNPAGSIGSGSNQAPRAAYRWDVKILRNADTNEVLAIYGNHLKAGDTSTDKARRGVTADAIRNDANALDTNYQFLFGGDLNMQSSNEAEYQTFVGSSSNNRGRFLDPIRTPGSWNNSSAYRFVHTQDPSGAGGMDDRFDQVLIGGGLADGVGTDYVGNSQVAYSTTTWNDVNHSYRVWGNDGSSFNSSLTTTGNSMVGSSIAQSLINTSTTAGGHLPVFLDLKYAVVPEPASMMILGVGLAAILRRRRR